MSTKAVSTLDDRASAMLPLSPILMHILLALVDQSRHGLGIADHVEEITGSRMSLGPGTLYGSIKRLLEMGLIVEPAGRPSAVRDDPRRRYYAISPLGRRTLELDLRDRAGVMRVAKAKGVL